MRPGQATIIVPPEGSDPGARQYRPGLLKVYRYRENETGYGDVRRLMDEAASVSVSIGYQHGEQRELSLDPAVATVTFSDKRYYPPANVYVDFYDLPMKRGDVVRVFYGPTIVFTGKVTDLSVSWEVAGSARNDMVRQVVYQCAGLEADINARALSWATTLPAEPAITRLRRWWVVDTSQVDPFYEAQLSVTVPAAAAGESTYFDVAREFTAATRFPVRVVLPSKITDSPSASLTVLNPTADEASAHIDAAQQWATSIEFEIVDAETFWPASMDVTGDDVRLLGVAMPGGGYTVLPFTINVAMVVPSPVFDGDGGFQPPALFKLYNRIYVASRISHSFTSREYSATVEAGPTSDIVYAE